MNTLYKKFVIPLVLLSFLVTSCSGLEALGVGGNKVTVSIYYGSEKQEWLQPLVEEYNNQRNKTASGATIVIEATPMGSIESVNGIISGDIKPVVWSPASSVYVPVANAEWRNLHGEDLVTGTPRDLVLSPVVIAMWRPMAEALGWPNTPIGWEDIAHLATSQTGWADYGYPEWGSFKLGHTHPSFSNSGIVSIIAETYAGLGKQRGLTIQDLNDANLRDFMTEVESSIIHYGRSTGFFAERMFDRGPSYLSAAVLYENLIVAQENKRLSGESSQLPVVAIYPKEGTFWSNHPYIVLNTSWVTAEQKEAAEAFENFLLDRPQQMRAIELGFRPADPSIPLNSPLDAQHGVDTSQPQTILEVPNSEVIQGVVDLWHETKKPVDLAVVMDTSGSMSGEKISAARSSLIEFINLLDARDNLEVITFNTDLITMTPLSGLGAKRDDVARRVSGVTEEGGTRLYDATSYAYQELRENGDPKHIRAIVVLTDGQDTDSNQFLTDLLQEIGGTEEGGNAIKVFTIAFGEDADLDVLSQIADITGGKQFQGDPSNIREIYAEIATFF